MNIGRYLNYNNHITFMTMHTKIGTPYENMHCYCANRSELLIWFVKCWG